jgi:hypothetical protein
MALQQLQSVMLKLASNDASILLDDGREGRSRPRIDLPFRVTARGIDANGERFTVHTVLDNLSASGLYLRLPQSVDSGKKLLVIIYLSTRATPDVQRAAIALRGTVVRVEPQGDGCYGYALALAHHHFLYRNAAGGKDE